MNTRATRRQPVDVKRNAPEVPGGDVADSVYPDTRDLTDVLTRACSPNTPDGTSVVILDRHEFKGSTFPVEIVSCQLPDGRHVRLFCKYESGRSHTGHGHRRGVSYEADVYERVLSGLRSSAPAYFGRHRDRPTGDTWLFIEALDGKSIANTHRPDSLLALRQAAGWIGRLHRECESRASELQSITRYESGYYRGFVDRAMAFSRRGGRDDAALLAVYQRADEFIDHLVTAQPTLIHGEFYPGNVLCEKSRICPVDWESTAVAPGELDLASLTEGWQPAIVAECEQEYARARWPGGAPTPFQRTLCAARLYWAFRWLGDKPERFDRPRKSGSALARLFDQAERWSLT
jgi:hypothetical protein